MDLKSFAERRHRHPPMPHANATNHNHLPAGGTEYPIIRAIRAHSGPSVHITVYQGRCGRRLCPAHHGLAYKPPDEARSFDNQKIPRRPTLIGGGTFPLVLFPFSANFYRCHYVIGRYFVAGWSAGPGRAGRWPGVGVQVGGGHGHGGSKSSRSWPWPSAFGPVRMARRSVVGRLQW